MSRYVVTLEKLCDCGRVVARGALAHIEPYDLERNREQVHTLAEHAVRGAREVERKNADAVVSCTRDACDVCVASNKGTFQ